METTKTEKTKLICKSERIKQMIQNDPIVAYHILIKDETDARFVANHIDKQWTVDGGTWTATKNIEFMKNALFSFALNKK